MGRRKAGEGRSTTSKHQDTCTSKEIPYIPTSAGLMQKLGFDARLSCHDKHKDPPYNRRDHRQGGVEVFTCAPVEKREVFGVKQSLKQFFYSAPQ